MNLNRIFKSGTRVFKYFYKKNKIRMTTQILPFLIFFFFDAEKKTFFFYCTEPGKCRKDETRSTVQELDVNTGDLE